MQIFRNSLTYLQNDIFFEQKELDAQRKPVGKEYIVKFMHADGKHFVFSRVQASWEYVVFPMEEWTTMYDSFICIDSEGEKFKYYWLEVDEPDVNIEKALSLVRNYIDPEWTGEGFESDTQQYLIDLRGRKFGDVPGGKAKWIDWKNNNKEEAENMAIMADANQEERQEKRKIEVTWHESELTEGTQSQMASDYTLGKVSPIVIKSKSSFDGTATRITYSSGQGSKYSQYTGKEGS
jgi:hypothetical protein